MPRVIVEWDAGSETYDLDEEQYADYLEYGQNDDDWFDFYTSDVYIEKYAKVVD